MKRCSPRMERRSIFDLMVARATARCARLPDAPAEMMHEAVLAADGAALHI